MSRKFILSVILAILAYNPIGAQEQNSKWDADKYTYINYKYGFIWHLNEDLDWKIQTVRQKDAIFAASVPGSFLVSYILATKLNSKSNDIWENHQEFLKGVIDNLSEDSGKTLIYSKKVLLQGKRAIKTKLGYNLDKDDRYKNSGITFSIISYSVVLNDNLVTFEVMFLNELEEELQKYELTIENTLFSGILLTKPELLK